MMHFYVNKNKHNLNTESYKFFFFSRKWFGRTDEVIMFLIFHTIAICLWNLEPIASLIQTNVIAPHSKYSWIKFSIKSILATKDKWLYVWKTKHQWWRVYREGSQVFYHLPLNPMQLWQQERYVEEE